MKRSGVVASSPKSSLQQASIDLAAHMPFFDAIRESPNDQTPKRIYADWLEEQGDLDRAEDLRLALDLELIEEDDPQRVSFEAFRDWKGADGIHSLPPLSIGAYWGKETGGMVQTLHLDFSDMKWKQNELRQALRLTVINRLQIEGLNAPYAQFLTLVLPPGSIQCFEFDASCELKAIETLLDSQVPGSHLRLVFNNICLHESKPILDFLQSRPIQGIKLVSDKQRLWSAKGFDLFLNVLEKSGLKDLTLSGEGWSSNHIRRLWSSPVAENLHSVELIRVKIGDEVVGVLAGSTCKDLIASKLKKLELSLVDCSPGFLCDQLANAPRFPDLRTLKIHRIPVGRQGFETLISGNGLPELRRLSLSSNAIHYQKMDCPSSIYSNVKKKALFDLDLSNNLIGSNKQIPLFSQPFLHSLSKLDLSSAHLTNRGVALLLDGKIYSNLVYLNLRENDCSDTVVPTLTRAESHSLPALKYLNFSHLSGINFKNRLQLTKVYRGRFRIDDHKPKGV